MPPSGKVFVKPGSLAQKKKSSEIQRDKQSEKKTGKTGLVQKKKTYEIQREKQIEKNTEIMQSLGIHVKSREFLMAASESARKGNKATDKEDDDDEYVAPEGDDGLSSTESDGIQYVYFLSFIFRCICLNIHTALS